MERCRGIGEAAASDRSDHRRDMVHFSELERMVAQMNDCVVDLNDEQARVMEVSIDLPLLYNK